MNQEIKALKFEIEAVGKHIKDSKKRYLWSVAIGERVYNFILDTSLISGKVKLSINGKIFHESEGSTFKRVKYNHSFIIDGCLFNLIENEEGYEFKVNNKLFSHLLNQELKKAAFTEDNLSEGFTLNEKIKQDTKKITLNLPGMSNAMKKKKGPQTQNWSTFAGETSFPNYFGDKTNEPQKEKIEQKVEKKEQETAQNQQAKIPSAQQYCTLQNLFKTINSSGKYESINSKEETPTYNINEIPVIPEINLEEFNTMQNLFATLAPSQMSEEVKAPNPPANKSSTESGENQSISKQLKPQLNLNDFNTMQHLFKTNVLENQVNNATTIQLPSVTNQQNNPPSELGTGSKQTIKLDQINIQDFNTMQQMFATLQFDKAKVSGEQVPAQNQKTIPPDFSKININDFNTMQNLFATNSLPKEIIEALKSNSEKQRPSQKQEIQIDISDFNTMQNMFKTGINLEKPM